jgi:hypothetical protein
MPDTLNMTSSKHKEIQTKINMRNIFFFKDIPELMKQLNIMVVHFHIDVRGLINKLYSYDNENQEHVSKK